MLAHPATVPQRGATISPRLSSRRAHLLAILLPVLALGAVSRGAGQSIFTRFPTAPGIGGGSVVAPRLTVVFDRRNQEFTPARGTFARFTLERVELRVQALHMIVMGMPVDIELAPFVDLGRVYHGDLFGDRFFDEGSSGFPGCARPSPGQRLSSCSAATWA